MKKCFRNNSTIPILIFIVFCLLSGFLLRRSASWQSLTGKYGLSAETRQYQARQTIDASLLDSIRDFSDQPVLLLADLGEGVAAVYDPANFFLERSDSSNLQGMDSGYLSLEDYQNRTPKTVQVRQHSQTGSEQGQDGIVSPILEKEGIREVQNFFARQQFPEGTTFFLDSPNPDARARARRIFSPDLFEEVSYRTNLPGLFTILQEGLHNYKSALVLVCGLWFILLSFMTLALLNSQAEPPAAEVSSFIPRGQSFVFNVRSFLFRTAFELLFALPVLLLAGLGWSALLFAPLVVGLFEGLFLGFGLLSKSLIKAENVRGVMGLYGLLLGVAAAGFSCLLLLLGSDLVQSLMEWNSREALFILAGFGPAIAAGLSVCLLELSGMKARFLARPRFSKQIQYGFWPGIVCSTLLFVGFVNQTGLSEGRYYLHLGWAFPAVLLVVDLIVFLFVNQKIKIRKSRPVC